MTASNGESLKKACDWIKSLTEELKIGEKYQGKVKKILEFGAFVDLPSGDSGLVHVSEIAPFRVDKPSDFLEEGEIVPVKLIKIDEQGRMNFSIKQAADPEFYEKKKKVKSS